MHACTNAAATQQQLPSSGAETGLTPFTRGTERIAPNDECHARGTENKLGLTSERFSCTPTAQCPASWSSGSISCILRGHFGTSDLKGRDSSRLFETQTPLVFGPTNSPNLASPASPKPKLAYLDDSRPWFLCPSSRSQVQTQHGVAGSRKPLDRAPHFAFASLSSTSTGEPKAHVLLYLGCMIEERPWDERRFVPPPHE